MLFHKKKKKYKWKNKATLTKDELNYIIGQFPLHNKESLFFINDEEE